MALLRLKDITKLPVLFGLGICFCAPIFTLSSPGYPFGGRIELKYPSLCHRKTVEKGKHSSEGISLDVRLPKVYMDQAKKQLDIGKMCMSKKTKVYVQSLVNGLGMGSADGKKILRLLEEAYTSAAAREFMKFVVNSYAIGEYIAANRDEVSSDYQKIGAAWPRLSLEEKGLKMGRFIAKVANVL